jgi:Protein of unknown function (DUF1559)
MPRHDDEYEDDDRPRSRRSERDDFDSGPRPRKKGLGIGAIVLIVALIVVLCGGGLIGGLMLSVVRVREAANRMSSSNNMKQVGLAFYNYNSAMDELPDNSYGPDGKPLLSWRVHILPYIEQDNLYKQFKLDEPWDGPNNIRLLSQMPKIYSQPGSAVGPQAGKTYYRGFSNSGAIFEKRLAHKGLAPKNPFGDPIVGPRDDDRLNFSKFKDRLTETFLVVEAGDAVDWTKPDDLDASPGKPFPKLGGLILKSGRFQALLADGSVKTLKLDLPETTLRALVTHGGGESLPPGWDD